MTARLPAVSLALFGFAGTALAVDCLVPRVPFYFGCAPQSVNTLTDVVTSLYAGGALSASPFLFGSEFTFRASSPFKAQSEQLVRSFNSSPLLVGIQRLGEQLLGNPNSTGIVGGNSRFPAARVPTANFIPTTGLDVFSVNTALGFNSSGSLNFGATALLNSGALFGLRSKDGVRAAGLPGAAVDTIAQTWQALGARQLDVYYNDPAVSAQRAQANAYTLAVAAADPWVVYLSIEISQAYDQLSANAPSYQQLVAVNQEIASWTAPPASTATLAQRYATRMQASALTAQVSYEISVLLAANPALNDQLNRAAATLAQRLQDDFADPVASSQLQRLNTAVQQAYWNSQSLQSVLQSRDKLLADNPPFARYLDLNAQLTDAVYGFQSNPLTVQLAQYQVQLSSDPYTIQLVQQAYADYSNAVTSILARTSYNIEVERYWEQLNGLFQSSPAYRTLQAQYQNSVVPFQARERAVHDAVVTCVARSGQNCDPYSDPQVTSLIRTSTDLIAATGDFLEQYNRFEYNIYQTDAYRALASSAAARLQSALSGVTADLQAAANAFNSRVSAIPTIARYQQLQAQLANTVLQSPSVRPLVDALNDVARQLTAPGPSAPDLVVTSFTTAASAQAGGQLSCQAVIRNQGNAPAPPFRIAFYYVAAGSGTPASVTVNDPFSHSACTVKDGLAPGASYTCNGPINVPAEIAGTYIAGVIADDMSEVVESDESNNGRLADTGRLTITPNSAAPAVSSGGVASAASYRNDSVAPGELVVIFGSRLGPATASGPVIGSDGLIAKSVSGVRVLFGGVAAPLLYVSDRQISAVVPYSVAGLQNVSVQVEYNGLRSAETSMRVIPAAPAIFTADSSGTGRGAIVNADNSFNGPDRPAARGSIVIFYATGLGVTTPGGVDGAIVRGTLGTPAAPIRVTVGGMPAQVLYAGPAPGFVSGLMQFNITIPANAPAGDVPLLVEAGGQQSRPGVAVSVR